VTAFTDIFVGKCLEVCTGSRVVDADMKSSLLSTNMAADRLRISVLRVFVEGEFLLEAEREHNEKGQS